MKPHGVQELVIPVGVLIGKIPLLYRDERKLRVFWLLGDFFPYLMPPTFIMVKPNLEIL